MPTYLIYIYICVCVCVCVYTIYLKPLFIIILSSIHTHFIYKIYIGAFEV